MWNGLKDKNVPMIAGSVVAIVAIFAAVLAYRSSNERYYLVNSGRGTIYKIDRRTGQTWAMSGTSITAIKTPDPDPKLTELPADALEQIRGRGSFSHGPTFSGTIYNGSFWYIRKIEIQLTTHSKSEWTRSFLADVSISPAETGEFTVNTLDGHIVDIGEGVQAKAEKWNIVGALGFKK